MEEQSSTAVTPPRLAIDTQDSDRVKAIKEGLNDYFVAVSLQDVTPEVKLQAIAKTFSMDAELITRTTTFKGADVLVQKFYASPESPVMKDPRFCPRIIDPTTICVSKDENTIAVEIALTESFKVGDWFTFDENAKIKRLRIYM